jgi:hypothetical protein
MIRFGEEQEEEKFGTFTMEVLKYDRILNFEKGIS